MASRLHWIDVLKGIGIFLVIMGHTFKDSAVYYWIYSFHMPLFFLISGFLIEPKPRIVNFKCYFINKCKSLLWPFVFFRILLFVYWLLVESHFRNLDLGPIWFLIVLFFDEIFIAPLLLKYRTILHSIICMIICVLFFYLLDKIDYAFLFDSSLSILKIIPGWAMRVFNAGIWFSAGFLLHKLGRYNLTSPVWPYLLLLVFSIISFSMFYENKDVSMYCNIVGNWFLYFILAFSGIGISFIVCRYLIKESKIIEWVGTYTIIILAIHEPIKRIVLFILKKVTGIDIYFLQRDVFYAFIISLCVLCMCVPVILIFRWLRTHSGFLGQYILSFVR